MKDDFEIITGEWDLPDDGSATHIRDKMVKDKALRRKQKNDKIHFIKAKALDDLCGRPKKGEQWRIITEKQFNAYALILSLLRHSVVDELYLAIYRINEPAVSSIIDFLDQGKIKKGVFVISNFFNQTKRPERWAIMLKAYCEKHRNTKHVYTHNHAKVLLLRVGGDHYVFEGSGNMSDNARIEQYLYENNESVYAFHKEWMDDLTKREKK